MLPIPERALFLLTPRVWPTIASLLSFHPLFQVRDVNSTVTCVQVSPGDMTCSPHCPGSDCQAGLADTEAAIWAAWEMLWGTSQYTNLILVLVRC